MNFEQFDQKIRDAALQRAFPLEQDVPDRLNQLLRQLQARGQEQDKRREERAG
ncbi:hypothetical protein [Limimaricola soesokkakensis]|uniref:hypothetical protein n=1 Tax=Limimaricola soesokkakensis TaxID=1343159 RepID=UPI003517C5C8